MKYSCILYQLEITMLIAVFFNAIVVKCVCMQNVRDDAPNAPTFLQQRNVIRRNVKIVQRRILTLTPA